jgi:mannose-6-phosphate isomerase-like protein (cupin superfamily)
MLPFIVKAGDDRRTGRLRVAGAEISVKISSEDTGGAYNVFEGVTPPLSGPPLHCHRSQDEWWYIVSGEFRFRVGEEIIFASTGDTVFAPRGVPHTFQNIGEQDGVTLTTAVPGGLDTFFEELNTAVPDGGRIDPAAVLPIFEKHDMELLGPPLSVMVAQSAAHTRGTETWDSSSTSRS